MEVGSKALREVEFRQQMRGYHQDDVDKFLEEVAAGIEVLQDRLREANERASRTEAISPQAVPPRPGLAQDEDAARRALDVAQRTVSLLIKEAKEEARRLVSEAESRAHTMLEAAEEAADRRMLEGRNELRDEVGRLTAARAELAGQVSELADQVEEGRRHARESLRQALELLEDERPARLPGAAASGSERMKGLSSGQGEAPNGDRPRTLGRDIAFADGEGMARHGASPGPASSGPEAEHVDAADRDDPEATRMLRLGPVGSERGGVFDVEQADS